MKTLYISLSFFAILLVFFAIMYFVDIPAPSKDMLETFNLELKLTTLNIFLLFLFYLHFHQKLMMFKS